jgi:hypothetical protein
MLCVSSWPEKALLRIKSKSRLYLAIGTGALLNKSAIPATPAAEPPTIVLPKIKIG